MSASSFTSLEATANFWLGFPKLACVRLPLYLVKCEHLEAHYPRDTGPDMGNGPKIYVFSARNVRQAESGGIPSSNPRPGRRATAGVGEEVRKAASFGSTAT